MDILLPIRLVKKLELEEEIFNIEDLDVGYDSLYDRSDAYTNHSTLTKLTENTSRYDYSYHGINGNEKKSLAPALMTLYMLMEAGIDCI